MWEKQWKAWKSVNGRVYLQKFAVGYANYAHWNHLFIFPVYFKCNSVMLCTHVVEICVLYMYFTLIGILYMLYMYFMRIGCKYFRHVACFLYAFETYSVYLMCIWDIFRYIYVVYWTFNVLYKYFCTHARYLGCFICVFAYIVDTHLPKFTRVAV